MSAIIRGYQRFDLLVIRTIGLATLDRGAVVLLLFLGYGIVSVIAVTLSINILTFILFYFVIRSKFPQVSLVPSWNRERFLQLFHFSKWKFIGGVSVNFLQNMPNMIIGSLVGVSQVTYFVVPKMLAKKVGKEICSTLNRVIYPFMSESVSIDTEDQKKDIYFRSVKWLFSIMAPSTVFLFVFGDRILTLWINEEMSRNGAFILKTFAVLQWFKSITYFGVSIFEAHGKTKFPNLTSLFILGVSLSFYFVFIPNFGINGIPIAHILTLPVTIYFQNKVLLLLNSNWREFLHLSIGKPLIGTLLTGLILYQSRFLNLTIIVLLLLVPVTLIIHLTVYYFIKVLDHIDYEILKSFIKRYRNSALHKNCNMFT
jgi:O-antigen/teichoic acid export membrane protein